MPQWRRTLWIMFIAQLSTSMGFSTIFPFLPLYVKTLGSTTNLSIETLSGLVFSSQAFTMMIASPFWGALADRYGRKPMVVRAMLGGAATIFLMGFVRTAEELIVLRALQGLLSGVISAASALIASVTPREKTGYAMGMLQLGLWSGVSLGPLTGGVLSDFFGFRVTFILTGVLLTFSGLLVWGLVEETFVPPAKRTGGRFHLVSDWAYIFKTPRLLVTLTLRFLSSLGRSTLGPILPLFMQVLLPHASRIGTYTGLVVGVASASSTASSVYLGRLGDKTGHARIVLASSVGAAFFFSLQAFAATAWQLLLLNVFTGACLGGLVPSLSALLARNCRACDVGSVYGFDNSIQAAGRAVAPMLGAAIAVWFSVRGAFLATGIIFLAASLLSGFVLRRTTELVHDEPGTPDGEMTAVAEAVAVDR